MKQKKLQIALTAVCAFLTLSGTAQTVCWLSRPDFLSVMPFGNKLFKVSTYNYQAIVNGRGRIVTTADSITFLTNGYALSLVHFNDRYLLKGIINREGSFTQFRGEYYATEKSFFSEDKCLVVNKKGKISYIDPVGNIIDNKYQSSDAPDLLTANIPFKPAYNTAYTVFEKDGKKGYMMNGSILLPAQFDEAGLFADGLAIVKKDGKYGILRYLSGSVDCKVTEKSGRLDVSAIVPPAWDDKEARFVRISNNGQRLSLSMTGLRSMRSLTADVPIESGAHQYELSVDGLVIWNGSGTATVEKKEKPKAKTSPSKTDKNAGKKQNPVKKQGAGKNEGIEL